MDNVYDVLCYASIKIWKETIIILLYSVTSVRPNTVSVAVPSEDLASIRC